MRARCRVLLVAWIPAAGIAAAQPYQVEPGSRGNEYILEARNRTGRTLTRLQVEITGQPAWLSAPIVTLDPEPVAPDSSVPIRMRFDAAPDVPAGTAGVLRLTLSAEGRPLLSRTVRMQAAVPRAYALGQNFPNPFNPSTVLRFDLPEESHVRLVVFDLLGREVRRLVDELRPAGIHSVRWDGTADGKNDTASGVYFARLEARSADGGGAFTGLIRMVLLR
jgi:hypothetical protein